MIESQGDTRQPNVPGASVTIRKPIVLYGSLLALGTLALQQSRMGRATGETHQQATYPGGRRRVLGRWIAESLGRMGRGVMGFACGSPHPTGGGVALVEDRKSVV